MLTRLPDIMRQEMIDQVMKPAGDEILAQMKANAPVGRHRKRKGTRLREGLSMRVLRSMRMQVGIIGKIRNRRLWYSKIVEFGRKGKHIVVIRNRAAAFAASRKYGGRPNKYKAIAIKNKIAKPIEYDLPPLAPRPFLFTPRTDLRTKLNERIKDFWRDTLRKASQGVSDD